MLSRKAKYGLKALIFLAGHAGEGPVLIGDLAESERIPRKFLEQILLELKKKGLLASRKGRGGGYQLGRPPEAISMAEVVRILDGPLAPVSCVSVTAYRPCEECLNPRACGIRLVMQEVRDGIADILDNTSLRDVLKRVNKISRKGKIQKGVMS
jgi:Rrf2 family protein